ncbi:MAG: NUDIX domain-containing protein [Candidatus Eisenbacteria bacterium]
MRFHYLARGIVSSDGKVLLVHKKGAGHTFLPGGHIESGEKAETALIREIEEETGKTATVRRFVGAVEHVWHENNAQNHEINLVFEISIPDIDSSAPPESLEPDIEFIWSDPADLKSHNLQPHSLIECLLTLRSGYTGFWGTTIRESK